MFNFMSLFRDVKIILFKNNKVVLSIFSMIMFLWAIFTILNGNSLISEDMEMLVVFWLFGFSIFVFAILMRKNLSNKYSEVTLKNIMTEFIHYTVLLVLILLINLSFLMLISMLIPFFQSLDSRVVPTINKIFEKIPFLLVYIGYISVLLAGFILSHFFLEKKPRFWSFLNIWNLIKTKKIKLFVFLVFIYFMSWFFYILAWETSLFQYSLFSGDFRYFIESIVGITWFVILLSFQLVFVNKLKK